MHIRTSLISVGFLVLIGAGCSPLAKTTPREVTKVPDTTVTDTTESDSNRYTDTDFGYAFSYPKGWTVTEEPVGSTDDNGYLSGGSIVKRLRIEGIVEDSDERNMTIRIFRSPTRSITEFGFNGVNPVGENKKYFFDEKKSAWMYTTLASEAGPTTPTTTAVVSKETVSGLPVFLGAARHDAEYIIPLDDENFVIVTEINGSWDGQPEAIVESIDALP